MANYCTAELIYRFEYKYKTLEYIEKVGIAYAKISLNENFCMTHDVVTSIHDFLKVFSK